MECVALPEYLTAARRGQIPPRIMRIDLRCRSIIDDGSKKMAYGLSDISLIFSKSGMTFSSIPTVKMLLPVSTSFRKSGAGMYLQEIRHIQTPDHAVAVITACVLRGKMRSNERRIGPVKQTRPATMMLSNRKKFPETGILRQFRIPVFPKTTKDLRFQR